MKKLLLLAAILFTISLSAQSKYFIYFKDKGIDAKESLYKGNSIYQLAESELTERAIERRKKLLGDDYIDYTDVPIKREYLNELVKFNIKIENELKWFNSVSAYLTDEQVKEIKLLPFIEKIEPVKKNKFKKVEENQNLNKGFNSSGNLYGPSFAQVDQLQVPIVHSKGITGKNVILGILDSGFRWKMHESLQSKNVLAEYDFIFKDNNTANETGDDFSQDNHGTAVFSAMAGYSNGKLIGPAYDASFLLAKTEDVRSETHIEEDNYAAALIWMENQGVDITSSSLGYSEFDDSTYSYTYKDMDGKSTIVTKAAELAFSKGVLVISAAGNEGNTSWYYITSPSDGFNVIAVGAVDLNNRVTGFSSRGPSFDNRIKPDVTALGSGVYAASTAGFTEYYYASGTSLATPLASGTAALLLSSYPHLNNVQLRSILLETADSSKYPNNLRGYGLLSALRAINYPNLQKDNLGNIYINKAFYSNSSTTDYKIIIYQSDVLIPMSLTGDNQKTQFQLNNYLNNINGVYFTYKDSGGNEIREPKEGVYRIDTKNLLVTLNTSSFYLPDDYTLAQNYPNPFNLNTTIEFYSLTNQPGKVIVYNVLGEKVAELFNGVLNSGYNTFRWDGKLSNGNVAPSGAYLYSVETAGKLLTKKMMLLK
ncbi:MAG: S8 family serine peptidase [Syntrophothermus sp.]